MNDESAVLNPMLYSALVNAFGDVDVAARGEVCYLTEEKDAVTGRWRVRADGGEYYLIRCPKCEDTWKKRLWISYMWGSKFEGMYDTYYLNHLAICYHKRCDLSDLPMMLWEGRPWSGQTITLADVAQQKPRDRLRTFEMPTSAVPLDQLPSDHPAVTYLLYDRRFDPKYLATYYHAFFCNSDQPYELAYRICFPIYFNRQIVGFQGRYIGEPPKGVRKYRFMTGTKKSLILYNFVVARNFPWVIVTEGIFDCIRAGANSVCSFGCSLSSTQLRLLSLWKHVALMYDDDAIPDVEAFRRGQQLGEYPSHAFPVILPKGIDPANMTYEEIHRRIQIAAKSFGIDLGG